MPGLLGTACKVWLLALFLVVCLAPEYLHRVAFPWQFLNQARAELSAMIQAKDSQWLVILYSSLYCVGFIWWGRSLNPECHSLRDAPAVVALVLYGSGVLAYASNYEQSSKSTDILVLCFGISLFFGFRFWCAIEIRRRQPFNIGGVVSALTLLLLSIAAVWRPEPMGSFQYRGQARWCGLWDSPNTFGMLMGAGFVLAIGRVVLSLKSKGLSLGNREERHLTPALSPDEAERESVPAAVWRWAKVILFVMAAGACGLGLVKSYSRGAWVGALCGLGYLAWSWMGKGDHLTPATLSATGGTSSGFATFSPSDAEKEARCGEWESCSRISCGSRFGKNWAPLSVLLISVLLLAFWNLRHADGVVLRRATSVGNANDFSWRKRVAAWEGALQMMADRPLIGFGWNQPGQIYDQFYRTPKVDEGMAIQLNDYFTLGTTLGVPALVCFCAFVGLSLNASLKPEVQSVTSNASLPEVRPLPQPPAAGPQAADNGLRPADSSLQPPDFRPQTSDFWLKAICRAGAVVLLVGFWFDGGLFKLATGALFWILLALGESS